MQLMENKERDAMKGVVVEAITSLLVHAPFRLSLMRFTINEISWNHDRGRVIWDRILVQAAGVVCGLRRCASRVLQPGGKASEKNLCKQRYRQDGY